ncbi:YihY/virulence factor BrkB family protein [Nocardia miyunensis]|uniref:YihY/virulence factor BrkB family protein n=1 Tax=Nocardia miyunensis TaxID=282684 RepID=UPI000A00DC54|nr:YihY/virulence factor BrkB family protein [Nocardia miyunensis]
MHHHTGSGGQEPRDADDHPAEEATTEHPVPTCGARAAPATDANDGGPAGRHAYSTALKRTVITAWDDSITDWAAAMTYYTFLALFPVLLVIVSVFGLSQPAAMPGLIEHVTALVPAQSRDLIRSALQAMIRQRSDAWLLTGFGTAAALWSGSSYLSVFRRAIYAIHHTDSRRPVWRTAPRILISAAIVVSLLVASALALVLTGTLTAKLGRLLRIGSAPLTVWDALRWPVLLTLAITLVLVLYRSGPSWTRPIPLMAPGGILAVALSLASSAGFALYASHAATYGRLYGSLAGLAVFLIWIWLSNLALVIGAQFNAELAKIRAQRAPHRSNAGTR